MNMKRPTDVSELRNFTIHQISPPLRTHSLNKLLKKVSIFTGLMNAKGALKLSGMKFQAKEFLFMLTLKTLILATNASPTGLGAVLSHQLCNSSERPIAFASSSLTVNEKKYSQIDKEAKGFKKILSLLLWKKICSRYIS